MFQIRLEPNGLWHRRSQFDRDTTACGRYIVGPVLSRYYDAGHDKLCPICFTPKERDTAKIEKLKKEHAKEDASLYFDEDEDPTDPNGDPGLDSVDAPRRRAA